jgi:uncharacterized protein
MSAPDFDQARAYARTRLEHDIAPALVYHSIVHTRDDVVPAVERLAALEQVDAQSLLLLRTAAWFHDLGFVECREGHEQAGMRIAAEVLPALGYTPDQVQAIVGLILATRLPQSPRTPLEQIIADADLDVLGRKDFARSNRALRAELAAYGIISDDAEWYRDQIVFLEGHRYWTHAARQTRDGQKQQNLAELRALLSAATAQQLRPTQC